MGFKYIVSTIQENDNNKIKYINFHNNQITDISLEMLKKFNDYFRNKKVVFALDKIICEKDNDENKYGEIECVMFT